MASRQTFIRRVSISIDFLLNHFPMLVKYFPDQAGEVVKYIRKAGYEDSEVLDLIDRTAGYTSKTACLYKGKSRKEHRKKLQQKSGNPCPDMSRNDNQ